MTGIRHPCYRSRQQNDHPPQSRRAHRVRVHRAGRACRHPGGAAHQQQQQQMEMHGGVAGAGGGLHGQQHAGITGLGGVGGQPQGVIGGLGGMNGGLRGLNGGRGSTAPNNPNRKPSRTSPTPAPPTPRRKPKCRQVGDVRVGEAHADNILFIQLLSCKSSVVSDVSPACTRAPPPDIMQPRPLPPSQVWEQELVPRSLSRVPRRLDLHASSPPPRPTTTTTFSYFSVYRFAHRARLRQMVWVMQEQDVVQLCGTMFDAVYTDKRMGMKERKIGQEGLIQA
ncbi:hypothetical protein CVT25_010397 [Psilocybe cyanescens]|uniref:Uncharacterized protein n=1 Tax=Psilocybe cyanescens TaxID=93625 RepID=A0A409XDI4_PSICY|nr:hypothetical protein CVT25_010397 [Psilocybe cyanescens]